MVVFRSPVMVGRDAELDRLLRVVADADHGHPRFVVIEGEAGIGKTRLAGELVARLALRSETALVLHGHGMVLPTGELPFGLLSEVVRDLTHRLGIDRATDLLGSETETLAALVPSLGDVERPSGPVDRAAVFGATAGLLRRLAADRLVVLWIDDLQWADSASLDVVEYVGRVATDTRLLILATVRLSGATDDPFAGRLAALHELPHGEVLRLDRLSNQEIAAQVKHLMDDRRPEPGLLERVCRLSDGIPFLAEELVSSGVATTAALPSSVRQLVLTRLPDLSAEARDVIDAAAVGEGHVHHRLLQRACGLGAAQFSEAIAPSIDAGILEVSHDRQRYRFRHALLQEALDQVMHPSRRMHWHERWARTLAEGAAPLSAHETAILIAQHWSAAGDDDEALRSALDGARAAAQLSAPKQEAELWQRALSLWPADALDVHGVTRGELAVRTARALLFAAQFEELLPWVRSLSGRTAGDAALDAWCRIMEQFCSDFLGVPGPTYVSTSGVPDLVDRLMATGTSWPAMDAIDSLWHEFPTHHVELFERTDEVLSRMAHALGDDHMVRGVMRHRAMYALETGRAEESLGHVEEELEDARTRSPLDLRIAQGNLARVLLATGRAAEAVSFGEQSLGTFAAPDAAPFLWSVLAMHHGRALLALGRTQECHELADRALQVAGEDTVLRGLVCPLWIKVHARRGLLDPARSLLEDIERSAPPEIAFDGVWSWYWSAYADLALATGDLSLLPRQRALLTDPVLIPSSDWVWEPLLNGLRAAITPLTGSRAAATESAELFEALDGLHRHGALGRAWSSEVTALRARAQEEDTPSDWQSAVEGWKTLGYPFDEAVCRLRLAESLLRHGERPAAEHELQLARDLARSLGAVPVADAISRVSRAAGIGGRTGSAAGALTDRETEVLRHVALGRTNQQIAGELFMSPKTVSVHVSRIITKLGAGNRTEAVAIGRGRGMLE